MTWWLCIAWLQTSFFWVPFVCLTPCLRFWKSTHGMMDLRHSNINSHCLSLFVLRSRPYLFSCYFTSLDESSLLSGGLSSIVKGIEHQRAFCIQIHHSILTSP